MHQQASGWSVTTGSIRYHLLMNYNNWYASSNLNYLYLSNVWEKRTQNITNLSPPTFYYTNISFFNFETICHCEYNEVILGQAWEGPPGLCGRLACCLFLSVCWLGGEMLLAYSGKCLWDKGLLHLSRFYEPKQRSFVLEPKINLGTLGYKKKYCVTIL